MSVVGRTAVGKNALGSVGVNPTGFDSATVYLHLTPAAVSELGPSSTAVGKAIGTYVLGSSGPAAIPLNTDSAVVLFRLRPSGVDSYTGTGTGYGTGPYGAGLYGIGGNVAGPSSFVDSGTVYLDLVPSATEVYSTLPVSYTDAATIRVKFTVTASEVYNATPPDSSPVPLPSPGPAIVVPTVKKFSVIHLNHDDYALGEIYPRNLDFAIYLNRIGYCNYDLDVSTVLGKKENTSPYETDFILLRGDKPIMGGEHTAVSINDVEGASLAVAGQEWGHWLERQVWPFNPDDPLLYTYLQTDRDIALVVKDLLTQVTAFPQSLDLDLSFIVAIGNNIDYKIDVNDTEDLFSKLTALAKRVPGFDFEITWDKRVLLYYPQKGGDSGITLTQGHNVYSLDYTNNGPVSTVTLGTARSASSQIGVVINSDAPQYRRSIATQDFGDITDSDQLIQQTQGEADRNVIPHRQITVGIIKDTIDPLEDIKMGDIVGLDLDIGYEIIEGNWRVVGMQCTGTDEGDEEWKVTIDDGTLSL